MISRRWRLISVDRDGKRKVLRKTFTERGAYRMTDTGLLAAGLLELYCGVRLVVEYVGESTITSRGDE